MIISWFLIFFINQAGAADGTQWPDYCLKQKIFPCVVYSYKKSHFAILENKTYLAKESLIELLSPSEQRFYKGVSWNTYGTATKVHVPFGLLNISAGSEVVIDFKENKFVVSVVSGKVKVEGLADKEFYDLTEGTEIEMGPVDYVRKMASLTLPRAISMRVYVKSIHQVFPFSDLNFQEHIDKVAKSIQKGLLMQSLWSQTIVETKMSDAHHEKLRRKYESEHAARRDSLLLRVFRKKNNFEEE